ncbi:MAG TPA: PKD domain-containing protein [Clostridia bacterium]|nr:PKD domain-containing protein [Clostridia bacterium]
MRSKQNISIIIAIAIVTSIFPLNVFAAAPYGGIYGQGTFESPVDYIKVYNGELRRSYRISEPEAKFSILDSDGKILITSTNTEQTLNLYLGDKVTFKNLSTLGSGTAFDKYDFQISHKGSVTQLTGIGTIESSVGFTFDDVGEYNIYFNIMDNTPMDKTDYWGNWSYNGSHRATGQNPGPTSSSSDDFYGYWYFVEIKVVVSPHSLTETHYDIDTGQELNKTVYRDITDPTYTTYSKAPSALPGYTYIGSKEGYSWDEADSCIISNASVTSRTARYGYVNNSYNNGSNNAFHWYYYRKLPGLFANFAIKYGGSDFTNKELVAVNLPVTANLVDLSVGENITSWTWEYKTPEMPAFQQFSTMQNPTMALAEEKTYTFKLTVKNTIEQKSMTHYVTVKKGNPPPENQSPEVEILGPKQALAGENVRLDGSNSYDPDGIITQFVWDYPDANFVNSNKDGDRLTVWYRYTGNNSRHEHVALTGTDDKGATGEDSHSIEILPPVPTAALTIDGIFKENRKVTLDASASHSPSRYPITNYLWSITNSANMKSIAALNGNPINKVIYKVAGTYNNTVTTPNTTGLTDNESKSITIVPDQNPNVNFAVTTRLLREPTDSNQALITISNLTASPDGDTIKKTVAFYSYDTDNDGNFDEEVWKYSTNGTAWNNVGLPYSKIKSGFDIYNVAGGNPMTFTLKTNQVGKLKVEVMAMEDIPAAETIPELITPSDYRRSDTFTTKPDTQKIIDVINTAPTVTFEVKKKKEVDVLIATDYTGQKLADLQSALNVQKANLLAKNIDVKYTIVNTTSAVAHVNDAMYYYRRYGRYNFQADRDSWSSSGNGNSDDDEHYQDLLLWEERTALESEAAYLPPRNPTNLNWWKSGTIHEEEPDDDTPDWERWYYNVYMQVNNDGYKNYDVLDFTLRRYNGLQSDDGSTYGYEYDDIEEESVSVDRSFIRAEKISDVTVNVNSVNFASVTSAPLRENSDRYLLFIGDNNSKIYSGAWGTHYPFGGLAKAEQDYIKANNVKPYIVTPEATLDTAVGQEKAKEVYLGNLSYFKSLDGALMAIIDYPAIVNIGGEVKDIYGEYILLTNGTLKYRVDGANFNTVVTGVSKVIQEKDGNGDILNNGIIWAVTSDGILRQFVYGTQGFICNYTDVIDVFNGNGLPYGEGSYLISCTSGTYFVFKGGGTVKTFYNAPLAGYAYMDAREWEDGDFEDYASILIYKNGNVQVGVVWKDSRWNSTLQTYVYYMRDINIKPLYGGIYNSTTETFSFYGFGSVKPIKGMNCIVGNSIYQFNSLLYEHIKSKDYYFQDMTNPAYIATNVVSEKDGIRTYSDGKLGIPCTWNQKYFGYKGAAYYRTVTTYIDVPALRNKTIKEVVTGIGTTAILTTDGELYKWVDTTIYTVPTTPIINLTLASSSVSDAYSFRYNKSSSSTQSFVTKSYYIDKGNLKDMTTGSVIYENIIDSAFDKSANRFCFVTKDGKLYGEGYFGKTGYRGWYPLGETLHELIKTRIVINDTTKQYITLRDIQTNVRDTKYFSQGQYQQAVNDITSIYLNDSSYLTNYIVVNDTVDYKVIYNDYENDRKYTESWAYNHEPNYFENSMGLASFHGQTLTTPITKFTKKGRYTINVKARDNPKSDNRFDNYRLWSTGNQNVTLYVHEKPVALFRVNVTPNGNGTFTVVAADVGSYDRDHTSRADKGIAASEWRWKEKAELSWHSERINKADCLADRTYTIQLRVRDLEGTWSDYMTVELDAANSPIALFTVDNNPLSINDLLRVKDQSFPQSLSTLTRWNWVVKKFNEDDTLPITPIIDGQYGTSNNGGGSLTGYDSNVKTDYNDTGPGKYRIYLRVRDSNGLWSDGGADSSYNLNNFYTRDIVVQESFKLLSFRVMKVKDLHLESYYYNSATGQYDDKPINVNGMAVDYRNFGVIVDGLTKGYLFEYELDAINFNDDTDTIVIRPHFYTCDALLRDTEECDLYWENSSHEVLKAGEGGHASWEVITLGRNDRTITGANTATWRGSYLIPGTAWAVPLGTSSTNAKASRINRDIIVNFEIKGYKNGLMRYDYNLQQWPLERTVEKRPYKIGDVIRYSHIKSNLDDSNVIINRP